jgi:hypothetical protein
MTIADAAVQGIHNAESLLGATANRLAVQDQNTSQVSDEVSLSQDAIALIKAKNEVAANVSAFHAADEMDRTLLNLVG